MIILTPALDWLTLTSYSREDFLPFFDILPPLSEPAGIRRYKGSADYSRSFFFGRGRQNDSDHYLLRLSGSLADTLLSSPLPSSASSLSCTRLDVQLSLPCDALSLGSVSSWRLLRDSFDLLSSSLGSSSPAVSSVESEDGFTIYVGSRQSQRMARVYLKVDDTGREFCRFECEFKGDYSRSLWVSLCDAADYRLFLASCLTSFFSRFSASPPVEFLLDYLSSGSVSSPARRVGSGGSLAWFEFQVLPGLWRLLHDHSAGGRARSLLASFYLAVLSAFPDDDALLFPFEQL